ncbi:hypothetical protein PHYBOEH_007791 [Phytophthora boehmeriae]|uniref:RxLR effector protein n=1 Tax=Phytophthora boehmeriae TaxID=109152 RepID=A0A8T1W8Y6_9STRA|nr:hypothetical protein PHYBOEH_007791 [Phytophthora boehmeriae]
MRASFFFIAATLLLSVVSAVPDPDHTALSKITPVNSVDSAHDIGNRFLRSTKVAEDEGSDSEDESESAEDGSEFDSEDDSDKEERSLHDLVRNTHFHQLDDVAGDLASVPGALKKIQADNEEIFKSIAANKWKPESLKVELGIAEKKAWMHKDQLMKNGDYLLYRAYKKFWNERKGQP